MEEKFCMNEGFKQKVQSMNGLKLEEGHVVIDADAMGDEEIGANAEDMMDPKVKRRLQKAKDALKDEDMKRIMRRNKTRSKKDMKASGSVPAEGQAANAGHAEDNDKG